MDGVVLQRSKRPRKNQIAIEEDEDSDEGSDEEGESEDEEEIEENAQSNKRARGNKAAIARQHAEETDDLQPQTDMRKVSKKASKAAKKAGRRSAKGASYDFKEYFN